MILKFFLLSCFCLVFLPTTLPSLPRGVMLLNPGTTRRNSATDIGKTSRKGAPERERPNRSVVKKKKKKEKKTSSATEYMNDTKNKKFKF